MKLVELLEQVRDRQTFLVFVEALTADREDAVARERTNPSSPYGPDAGGWENTTIESYLEAATAWAQDSKHFPAEPSWKAFAIFLYCGKIYE
jgi:hypothetical protein